MAGIRERDKRGGGRLRNSIVWKLCTTFVLCSQYVLLVIAAILSPDLSLDCARM